MMTMKKNKHYIGLLFLIIAGCSVCSGCDDETTVVVPEQPAATAAPVGDCASLAVQEIKCTSTAKDANGMVSLKPYVAADELYRHTRERVSACANYSAALWVYETAMEMLNAGRDVDAAKTWFYDAMRQMAGDAV